MCGPSSQEKSDAAIQESITSTLRANYNEYFAKQSGVLDKINGILTPIAEAGPDQQGIGPQELAALRTQSGEGVGNNYAKATQALNNTLAARGGGNEVLPTGSRAALQGSLASAAADESSREEIGITRANYDIGRSNWQHAVGGLDALAGRYNPTALGSEMSGSNQAAFGMNDKISQEQNQKEAEIAGGITSLAMDAATFGAGFAGGGGLAGGIQGLTGPSIKG
jgi:hypothetical protein